MTIAVDLGRKATKQTNKTTQYNLNIIRVQIQEFYSLTKIVSDYFFSHAKRCSGLIFESAYQNIIFLISQPKHVVGTQKNRLNETVLLSTQNIC